MLNASQIGFIFADNPLSSEWWSFTSSTLSVICAGLILAAVSAGRMYRRTREKAVDGRFEGLDQKIDKVKDKHGCEINDTRRFVDQLYQEKYGRLPDYPSRD